jgi:hypothetical protein
MNELQLENLCHIFYLSFQSCVLYKDMDLVHWEIHLRWTNKKGLTLNAKPDFKK